MKHDFTPMAQRQIVEALDDADLMRAGSRSGVMSIAFIISSVSLLRGMRNRRMLLA